MTTSITRNAYILCEHENTPRCIDSTKMLESIGFRVSCIPYIKHYDKVYSNKISMQQIYTKITNSNDEWSYVFEDDINKIYNISLNEIIEYEKISSHIFYLGACMPNLSTGHVYDSKTRINNSQVITLRGACHGLHAIALSKKGATELLQLSKITKERYMDVILKIYTITRPAHIVHFELMSPYDSTHRGVIYQDRQKYPTTI